MPLTVDRNDEGDVIRVWATIKAGREQWMVELDWADVPADEAPEIGQSLNWVIRKYHPADFDSDGRPMKWVPKGQWTVPASAALDRVVETVTAMEVLGWTEDSPGASRLANIPGCLAYDISGLEYALLPCVGWRMAKAIVRRFDIPVVANP